MLEGEADWEAASGWEETEEDNSMELVDADTDVAEVAVFVLVGLVILKYVEGNPSDVSELTQKKNVLE